MGRLCPSGFPTVARTAASPHLMHGSLVSWVSPYWNWGCGLEATFLVYHYCVGCRGPRPPRPYHVASSMVTPTSGYLGGHPSGIGTFLVPNPGNTRGRSTPEASQLPCLLHSAPDGSHYVDFGQRPRTGRYRLQIMNKFTILIEIHLIGLIWALIVIYVNFVF